ncbi:MAG TPA: tetratricopeptide repeat protein [Bryobacteraceae bacterium]|nr:tetratricopeptide repeat protein [Bryobacteraceae bacterium]
MVRYPEFRVLNRTFWLRLAVAALASVALLPAVQPDAQQIDEAWQTLVLAATRAASAKDYKAAEDLLQRATRIADRFPAGDPRTGTTQNTLGLVYRDEKKLGDAEKAFQNALTMLEKSYGQESIDVGNVNFNIASVMIADGKYDASLAYIQRSHSIFVKVLGAESLKAAASYCLLGEAYRNMGRFDDAEKPLKECADMREESGGVESPELADALYSLALVYEHQGRYKDAEPRLKLAAKIRELTLGETSPEFAEALEAHSALLKTMGRAAEAKKEDDLVAAVRRNEKK